MIYTSETFINEFEPTFKGFNLDKYQSVCCGFDIETTTIEHRAYMYIWQLSINDDVVIGRTWEEFKDVYMRLCDIYNTHSKRLLVWVHNLSFEFQFLKHRLNYAKKKDGSLDIFALDKRKICYFVTRENIEFRDSAVFTGMSLKKLAATFCKTQKMVGDLDYTILRNSKTKLSEKELGYCLNDVIILSEFAEFTFLRYGDSIPFTKTGIVRNKLKENFKQLERDEKKEVRALISRCFPDEEQYETWFRWVYRGGWVHANFEIVGETITEPMDSYDFKSSYPARCFDKMPMKWTRCKPCKESIKFVLDDIENYGFMIHLKLTELKRTTCHSIFSLHKTKLSDGAVYSTDNGRITYCSECELYLTEYDFLDMMNFYKWESIEYLEMLYCEKDYMPKFILDTIYNYFLVKETATGIDRVLAKSDLNSIYGMAVTSVIKQDIEYNEDSGLFEDGDIQSYDKEKFKQLMLPAWGIYISCIARHELLQICYEITKNSDSTSDACYGDTDSLKILHPDKHKHIIDEYNQRILKRNQAIKEKFGYDLKELGCFMWECRMKKFKTLGCKRYIYTTEDNDTHITIAGMPKNALDEYMKCPKFDVYKYFEDSLRLPAETSGKLTTCYNDEPHSDVVDGELMTELSSVALFDIPFSMNMETDFLNLIHSRLDQKKLYRERG